MKHRSHLYVSMLLASDVLIIFASCYFAYHIYAHLKHPVQVIDQANYFLIVPYVVCIWLVILNGFNLYRPKRDGGLFNEARDIVIASLCASLILYTAVFLYHGIAYSRMIIGIIIVTSTSLLIIGRITARLTLRYLRRRGYNCKRVLIVGAGDLGKKVADKIEKNKWTGFKVVGYLDDNMQKGAKVHNAKVLGCIRDINDVVDASEVDQVIIALPIRVYKKIAWIVNELSYSTVDTRIVPDMYQLLTLNSGIADLDGLPLLTVSEAPIYGWYSLFKRLFDVVFSLSIILITLPTMVIIAILIRLTSAGPIIFQQERMSLNCRKFKMLKFRTMVVVDKPESDLLTKNNDPRVTKLGKFLRKTSIDELPQFFNVLKGDMSIVGPRPERTWVVEEVKKNIHGYMLKHKMKAGITGWAQINGWRGNTSLEERIKHDLYYIEHWSWWLDVKIIFLTIYKGFVNQNAY